jgi:glycosyltransferase involved in cell wall biosynthesis
MNVGIIQPARYDYGGGQVWCEELAGASGGTVLWMQEPKFSSVKHAVLPKDDGDAVARLCEHDAVIVSTLRFPKGPMLERMLRLLRASKLPWTFMQHDTLVDKNPLVGEMLALPGFTGRALTTVREYGAEFNKAIGATVQWTVLPHLPYTNRCGGAPPMPEEKKLVSTSRTEFTKGIVPLARCAHELGIHLVLAGRSSPNRGGYASGALAELLRDEDWTMSRDVGRYDGNAWNAESPNGGRVSYLAGYASPYDVLASAEAHVNLASHTRAFGHLEYVTLEAMDVGVPCIVPRHQDPRAEYDSILCLGGYKTAGKCNFAELVDVVDLALSGLDRIIFCRSARSDLAWMHGPKAYARRVLEVF